MPARTASIITAATFALLGTAGSASAELVFLTSGRTLSVKGHQTQGESIVLQLRTGGEVTTDRSLIDRIEPDEVPYPEPTPEPQVPAAPISQWTTRVPFEEMIESISIANGVDPVLVKALIQVESGYRPRARSPKGAMGLMQLMPSVARQYSVRDPFDPRANVEAGIKHLKSLLQRFEPRLALAAYNAGEATVHRFGGIPPYRETRNYVSRILALVAGRR